MEQPIKKSKFMNIEGEKLREYLKDIDRDLENLFTYVKRFPKTYSQTTEPTIGTGQMAFWEDTAASKMHLIKDKNNTQKKVELT